MHGSFIYCWCKSNQDHVPMLLRFHLLHSNSRIWPILHANMTYKWISLWSTYDFHYMQIWPKGLIDESFCPLQCRCTNAPTWTRSWCRCPSDHTATLTRTWTAPTGPRVLLSHLSWMKTKESVSKKFFKYFKVAKLKNILRS